MPKLLRHQTLTLALSIFALNSAFTQVKLIVDDNSSTYGIDVDIFEGPNRTINVHGIDNDTFRIKTYDFTGLLLSSIAIPTDPSNTEAFGNGEGLSSALAYKNFIVDDRIFGLGYEIMPNGDFKIFQRVFENNSFYLLDTTCLAPPLPPRGAVRPSLYRNFAVRNSQQIGTVFVIRNDTDTTYGIGARVVQYHYATDSISDVNISIGDLPETSRAVITDRAMHFYNGRAGLFARFDLSGNLESYWDPLSLDRIELGYGITGGGASALINFDSSLYFFAPTSIIDLDADPLTRGQFMRIIKLDEEYNVIESVNLDTFFNSPQNRNGSTYRMTWLNRGTSVTPDGKRLFASGWKFHNDTITWRIYRFAPGFERLPSLEYQNANVPGEHYAAPEGILALSDGGAVTWGRNADYKLRVYRIAPDSAYIRETSASPEAPRARVPDTRIAYPNPAPATGTLTVDWPALGPAAAAVEVYSTLGQSVGRWLRGPGAPGPSEHVLPGGAGIYLLIARAADGRVLGRQRVVRP